MQTEPQSPAFEAQRQRGPEKVVFLPRHVAEAMKPPAGAVIISIHDVSEPAARLDPAWADRLTLCFHDTDDPTGVLTAMGSKDADSVIEFVKRHEGNASAIYVHCSLGVSRSAATALAISELLEVPCFKEQLPVSALRYPLYNRFVYRKMMQAAERALYF